MNVPTIAIVEVGAIGLVGLHASRLGARALVLTGRSAASRYGYTDLVINSLKLKGVDAVVFAGISANPYAHEVDEAAALAAQTRCDVIVALGGGSVIDAGKAVSVVALGRTSAADLIGKTMGAGARSLPLIAIPTIAGSGAEVTMGSIISDSSRSFRSGIRGEALFPRVALIDPDIAATASGASARASAFDAVTHAVEGIVSRRSTPISWLIGGEVLRLVARNARSVSEGTADAQSREEMSLASLYGGMSVATVSTCLPHRLQQAMGSVPRLNVSHGSGLAAIYPAWMKMAIPAAPKGFAFVAQCLGASSAIEGILGLRSVLGVDRDLVELGFEPNDVDQLVEGVSGNLDNDPIDGIDHAILSEIYRMSMGD